MDMFTYQSKIGVPEERDLYIDGVQNGSYMITPIIPFSQRSDAITAVIRSVVDDTDYKPYNYYVALYYSLIRAYTNIEFPPVEIEDIEGETEEERAERQSDANMSSIHEFITRSSIREELANSIPDFVFILQEIEHGIQFAKEALKNTSEWEGVGEKINSFMSDLQEVLSDTDIVELANSLVGTLSIEESTDNNKEE